jgi:hypothetical protein
VIPIAAKCAVLALEHVLRQPDRIAPVRRTGWQVHIGCADIGRPHQALAEPDARTLPRLLAGAQRHLDAHPDLADQIDTVTAHTNGVRRQTQQQRDHTGQPGRDDDAAAAR